MARPYRQSYSTLARPCRLARPAAEGLGFGQAFHLLAARYVMRCLDRGVEGDLDAEAYRPIALTAAAEIGLTPSETADLIEIADRWVGRFRVHGTAKVEESLSTDDGLLGGTIDYWASLDDGARVIRDHKTQWSIPTGKALDASLDQLRLYAGLIESARPGAERYDLVLDYVRRGHTEAASITPGEALATLDHYVELARAAEETEPLPRPGPHCSTCMVLGTCPAWTELGPDAEITVRSAEEAALRAGQLAMYEAAVSRMRRALAEWCDAAGPVRYGDCVLGHWPITRRRFPSAAEPIRVLAAGRDLDAVLAHLEVSRTAIERAARAITAPRSPERKQLLAELETILVEEEGTVFASRRADSAEACDEEDEP